MFELKNINLKRIKGRKITKKVAAFAIASTILCSASGCTDESESKNSSSVNEPQVSISTSFDADKIQNSGQISEEVMASLMNTQYGLMYYIQNYTDFSNGYQEYGTSKVCDYLVNLTNEQQEAIYNCAYHLNCHLNSSNNEEAKKELEAAMKEIKKFYGDKRPVEVIRDILGKFLPKGSNITVSNDNQYLVNKKGEVAPISIIKTALGYSNYVENSEIDYFSFDTLMRKGYAYGTGEVSEELENINIVVDLCGVYTYDPMVEFKTSAGYSYLTNEKMYKDVLNFNGAYEAMDSVGLFDGITVRYKGEGRFDVRVNNKSFYTIDGEIDADLVGDLGSILYTYNGHVFEGDTISSKNLKDTGYLDKVVYYPIIADSIVNEEKEKVKGM